MVDIKDPLSIKSKHLLLLFKDNIKEPGPIEPRLKLLLYQLSVLLFNCFTPVSIKSICLLKLSKLDASRIEFAKSNYIARRESQFFMVSYLCLHAFLKKEVH